MELWEIFDKNRRKTGKVVERGKPMKQDEYHLVVNVWMQNNKGEFLISKRTPNKSFPNMWETTGGSAVVGDDSLQAALREVKEEIGLDLSSGNGKCLFSLRRQYDDFPDFVDVWLFKENADITELVYQPKEVADAKWAMADEILSMIENGEFVDGYSYLDRLFNMDTSLVR